MTNTVPTLHDRLAAKRKAIQTAADLPQSTPGVPAATPASLLTGALIPLARIDLIRAFRDDGHGKHEHFDLGFISALRALGWTADEIGRITSADALEREEGAAA